MHCAYSTIDLHGNINFAAFMSWIDKAPGRQRVTIIVPNVVRVIHLSVLFTFCNRFS